MKNKTVYSSILIIATVAMVLLSVLNNRIGKRKSSSLSNNSLTAIENQYYKSLPKEQKQKITKLSPAEIIELYESTNERKTALALLHPALLNKLKTEPDLQNHRKVETCKDITEERNQKMGLPPLPKGIREFEVSFFIKKWPDLAFFTLTKDSHDGHWEIIGIGTSP